MEWPWSILTTSKIVKFMHLSWLPLATSSTITRNLWLIYNKVSYENWVPMLIHSTSKWDHRCSRVDLSTHWLDPSSCNSQLEIRENFGVGWELKKYIAEMSEDKCHKRSSVHKLTYAPETPIPQPVTEAHKSFMMFLATVHLECTLYKEVRRLRTSFHRHTLVLRGIFMVKVSMWTSSLRSIWTKLWVRVGFLVSSTTIERKRERKKQMFVYSIHLCRSSGSTQYECNVAVMESR